MVSAAPVWFTMLVQFVVAMVATISFGITFQVLSLIHISEPTRP